MPGLDPGIHPSRKNSLEEDGLPGQARQRRLEIFALLDAARVAVV